MRSKKYAIVSPLAVRNPRKTISRWFSHLTISFHSTASGFVLKSGISTVQNLYLDFEFIRFAAQN